MVEFVFSGIKQDLYQTLPALILERGSNSDDKEYISELDSDIAYAIGDLRDALHTLQHESVKKLTTGIISGYENDDLGEVSRLSIEAVNLIKGVMKEYL